MANYFKFVINGYEYGLVKPKDPAADAYVDCDDALGLTLVGTALLALERAMAQVQNDYHLSTPHFWAAVGLVMGATDVAQPPVVKSEEGVIY